MEDDRNDRREKARAVVFASKPLPDPYGITEESERHEVVRGALVLEKDVDEGRSSFQIDAEQQVGVAVAVAEFDEGTRRPRSVVQWRRAWRD